MDYLVNATESTPYQINLTDALYYNSTNDSRADNVSRPLYFDEFPPGLLRTGYVLLVIFSVVGLPGNLLSALAIISTPKLRNATSALVVNLCVSDGLYCALSTPLTALIFRDAGWKYSNALCVATAVIRFSNVGVSVFTIVAIAFNRYILIAHRNWYNKLYSKRGTAAAIATTWIVTILLILLPLTKTWGMIGYERERGSCTILPLNGRTSRPFLFLAAYFIPAIFFLVCYTKIYWVVHQKQMAVDGNVGNGETVCTRMKRWINRRKKGQNGVVAVAPRKSFGGEQAKRRTNRRLRVLKIVMVIFVTFTVCYLPLLILQSFFQNLYMPAVLIAGYMFFYLSASVNPFIYVAMSKEYRGAYVVLYNRVRSVIKLKPVSEISFTGTSKESSDKEDQDSTNV